MIKNLLFVVFSLIMINAVRSQITTAYNQTYLRDIIVSDSSIYTVHLYPSQDTLDYTNSQGYLELYKFDVNLNRMDSIILDSIQFAKCIERNGDIFIVATRVYSDTFTCSINLFHLSKNLDLLNFREIKEIDISFFATDFTFRNDSINMLVIEDRTMATATRYTKEFLIDTSFLDLDSVSCGIPTGPTVFYYKNAILLNNKRIFSGDLDFYNFNPPIYHVFSDDATCNQVTPFTLWYNYIYNANNFELMKGHSNYLLNDNSFFYISIGGEENFGNFNSFSGILKTDTLFNPIDFYLHQPTVLEENLVPFRNKGVLHFDDKILLASNTKMKAFASNIPYEENEIRIDFIDTSLSFISGVNLDPMPIFNRPYHGAIIEMMQDGSIILGGNLIPMTSTDPPLVFLVKYTNTSELLNITDYNSNRNSLIIYPNPVNDILKIERNFLFENSEVKFYDITGKLINSTQYTENGFSIGNFSSGVYFIQIQTESGIFSGKFMKD